MNRSIPLLLLVVMLLAGCDQTRDDMGVVARVNGRPIALSQLEFQHDLLHMDGAGTFVPSVEMLREEYGSILSELVILELIEQELEQRGLAVSDEELRQEEAKVRADYPDDAFEQVLVEEYIDIASWRRQVRYDLSRRKFYQTVLRPQVKVDYLEADEYYKNHIKEFRIPESYRLVVLRAALKEKVNKGMALYRETMKAQDVARQVPGVSLNELTVSAGQLSQEWKDALNELPEGEASRVLQVRGGFEALYLVKKASPSILGPTQAYPLVEEVLIKKKLSEAFGNWLDGQLATAKIEVSAHLLERETAAGQEETGPETSPSPESGDTDGAAVPSGPAE